MRKLIMATGSGFTDKPEIQIEKMANAGWDGFFTGYDEIKGNFRFAQKAKECGMIYQSIHANFHNADKLWEGGLLGDWEEENLTRCVRHASDIGVNLIVMHAIIGFDKFNPSDIGVERFGRVVKAAERYGVKIAVENTEGDAYFDKLLTAFKGNKNVGFCIDTGHEMCYNHSEDLIGKYSDQLLCTHLNDNMGITGESITWHDDSHMLPFDGVADWQKIADRLNKAGYKNELTFELTSKNKPNRNTHDIYAHLDIDGFIALALERAKKFRDIIDK